MALKRRSDANVVLIGFAEAYAAIEAAWSLRDAGYRVVAFTRMGVRPPLRRVRGVELHHVTPPELSAKRALEDVRALVRSIGPVAFLPLDDASLLLGRGLADEQTTIAGATGDAVEFALNKERHLDAARTAGLLVPSTKVVRDLAELAPLEYPVIVKPARALYDVADQLVRPTGALCADRGELERFASEDPPLPLLVQPLLEGTGEGLFGVVTKSGIHGWSAHRRIRMLNPQGSASSACESRPVDEALLGPATRFLEQIAWSGLFMLEFLRDAEGRPWLMELNGRAWGSMALARRRGFEYPSWTVNAALDEQFVPVVPQDPPPIVCRHLGLELAHLAFVLRGPQSEAVTAWPKLWPTLLQMLRFSRRDRFYNWRWSEPDVFISDTLSFLRFYARRALGAEG